MGTHSGITPLIAAAYQDSLGVGQILLKQDSTLSNETKQSFSEILSYCDKVKFMDVETSEQKKNQIIEQNSKRFQLSNSPNGNSMEFSFRYIVDHEII